MDIDTSYLKDNDVVVVATSGGPDSMCLLHLLNNCGKKLKIICAHVNHKIRIESDTEYQMVEKICQENDIIFEGMTILDYSKDNFHNDARIKRYEFFKELIKKYQAKYLATAHHGDDLMETILMKISRGSNLNGYSGFKEIKKENNYYVIRPLIRYTKKDIETYMLNNNLWYAIDKSNLSDHYTRNRYRHNVLPFLKEEDSQVHTKYLKFSKELSECDDFINRIIKKDIDNTINDNVINVEKFKLLEPFVEKRLISYLLHNIYNDNLFVISDLNITLIINLILSKKSNGLINLPQGYVGIKSYNQFYIKKSDPATDFMVLFDKYLLISSFEFNRVSDIDDKSNFVIRLNKAEIVPPLYFRNRHEGDKMKIKNLGGHRKIKDILIDEKVSPEERMKLPILVDSEDNILWLPGIKKSQFDKDKNELYDIIIKCERKKNNEEK